MHNLNELESRWLQYKIKSYIPYLVISSSLLCIVFVSFLIDFSALEEPKAIIHKEIVPLVKKEIPIIKETPKEITLIQSPPLFKQNTSKLVIEPSLNFINNIRRDSPQYYQEENIILPRTFVKEKKVEVLLEEDTLIEAPTVEIVKNTTISIQRKNTYEDIQHIIKRFQKSNNPALSLFAAKKYYELENYTLAYNYALITNEINNDIEESWIIFTKSLVKLGKKEKAIEILKKYINNSHSQQAKTLLDSIKSGKIR